MRRAISNIGAACPLARGIRKHGAGLIHGLSGGASLALGFGLFHPGSKCTFISSAPSLESSEVFDLKPTSVCSSAHASAKNRYTNTEDRQPNLISTSPLAFSLLKRENIPLRAIRSW